ncbi:MAG: endonuclease/exonuclease/phosphatase family protein [Desulforhopalus sp.]|nr:endonuclease/exonuclease/phosphatase family protein [Desulforhopalus sp.]
MRLLLYNIRYGTGHGSRYHLPVPFAGFFKHTDNNVEKIIKFTQDINPDIAALVEVDIGSYRSHHSCQAETIADRLGYYYIAENKYDNKSLIQHVPVMNLQANALLSRTPLSNVQYHYFEQGSKRLVIQVDIEDVSIFIVHLSLKFNHRQFQLEQLRQLIAKSQKEIIIAGDFNTFQGNRELDLFLAASGLRSANSKNLSSWPSHSPHRQLDFILYSAGLHIDNFFIPDITLSDHAPLVCDFSCVMEADHP